MLPSQDELKALNQNGWAILNSSSLEMTKIGVWAIGPIIQTTKVTPRPEAKAALATDREMDFHTDHPRAFLIAWHCVRQSSAGGYSLLKDGHKALAKLDPATQERLREATMGAHQVFKGDLERWPVVRDDLGCRNWIYYTPWLRRDGADAALDAFATALEEVETVRIRLEPGQVLLINNTRMLHGRSAIEGNKDRLLVRHWVGHPDDTFDRDSGW